VTRLRWTGDGFVPCPDQADVRVIDSWLVTDGRARAMDAHLRRFSSACASLYGVRAERFACAAVTRIPASGRWFPRLELALADDTSDPGDNSGDTGSGVRLRLWLRPAPTLGSTVRLWRPPDPYQRVQPRVKGPDLPYLAALRDAAAKAGADEALLVSADCHVLEGTTTSLLWWHGNTLCAPPAEAAVLPSVTRATLLDMAAARGIPVRFELVRPDELRARQVWAVNALHGVRVARLVLAGLPAPYSWSRIQLRRVQELLHHHEHEKQLTEAQREQLLSTGATIRGMVLHSESAADDRRMSRVRVSVSFKDGKTVQFSEELANLYQPAPGSQEAQRLAEVRGAEQLRHPDRIPKIQLPLSDGEWLPVRYDAADPSKMVIDRPALQKRTLHDYIQREQKQQGQPPARRGAATGPPWAVPAYCPNCGAPVDQAKSAQARDPHCQFCHQPIPVQPTR
jgi:branched-subunit amino acid aminotransferase/4-amino-4-deoxychorismate lyase